MQRLLFLAWLWIFSQSALAIELRPIPLQQAPPLAVQLVTGGKADLARLRGRVVVVNFWASWCPPCLMEMPSMSRLSKHMAKRPFVLLAVNAGEAPGWVGGVMARVRPSFAVGLDPNSRWTQAWGARVMPTSFIVDKQGYIRYSLIGPMEWDSPEMLAILAKLLAE